MRKAISLALLAGAFVMGAPVDTSAQLISVGEMAPDFALPGATRYGTLDEPVRLSDYRGETVVLAFFFRVRTTGCTVQMTAYRDQYASLFNEGQNVVVMGISNDSAEDLGSWLHDADFPFLFASDAGNNGSTYADFGGGLRDNNMVDSRAVIVVGPDGRIAGVIESFNQNDPTAYEELGAIVDRVTPEADD